MRLKTKGLEPFFLGLALCARRRGVFDSWVWFGSWGMGVGAVGG